MPNLLRRMTLQQRLLGLAVTGALLGAMALTPALQHQQGELRATQARAEGLDPVRTLVQLQRALQAHRGLASMVLSGNAAVDGERRARQGDVNLQLAVLGRQLATLGHQRATEPAQALKSGWEALSQRVDTRSISTQDSFEAHTALVEQNIVMLELVAQAAGLPLGPEAGSHPGAHPGAQAGVPAGVQALSQAVVQHLPRHAEALERLRLSGQQALPGRPLWAAAQAPLAHPGHPLQQLPALALGPLQGELAAAQQATDALREAARPLAAGRAAMLDAARLAALATQASNAQIKAEQAAVAALQRLLQLHLEAGTRQRQRLLAQMGGLLLAALILGLAARRSVTRRSASPAQRLAAPAAGAGANPVNTPRSPARDEAARWLARCLARKPPARHGQRQPPPHDTGRTARAAERETN